MTSRWLGRLATVFLPVAGALALSAPAWAATVTLNNGGVTAIEHDDHSCAQVAGGAVAGWDGWVFVLPGNSGSFISLHLVFSKPGGGTEEIDIPDPNDGFPDDLDSADNNGTAKATVQTPAGWTLVSGYAEITGTAANGKFNLTHTCPSTGPSPSTSPSVSPSPSPSPSKSASASASPSVSGSGSVGGSPETSTSTSTSTGTSSAPGGGGGGLPTTGTKIGLFVGVGLALIGGGVALLVLRRRRDNVEFTA